VLDGFSCIPEAGFPVLKLFQQSDVVIPGQFVQQFLHKAFNSCWTIPFGSKLSSRLLRNCPAFQLAKHRLTNSASLQLTSSLLANSKFWPSLGKNLHILEIGAGKPLHLRKSRPQVIGQPSDDFGSPALLGLPGQNVPSDMPVEHDQFLVHRQHGTLLGVLNALLKFCQPISVALRRVAQVDGCFIHDFLLPTAFNAGSISLFLVSASFMVVQILSRSG